MALHLYSKQLISIRMLPRGNNDTHLGKVVSCALRLGGDRNGDLTSRLARVDAARTAIPELLAGKARGPRSATASLATVSVTESTGRQVGLSQQGGNFVSARTTASVKWLQSEPCQITLRSVHEQQDCFNEAVVCMASSLFAVSPSSASHSAWNITEEWKSALGPPEHTKQVSQAIVDPPKLHLGNVEPRPGTLASPPATLFPCRG